MNVTELNDHIASFIQGGFGPADMATLKEEMEKLKAGDVYVEIGVDEGRSARTSHEYGHPGVFKFWIDIHDPVHTPNLSRAEFMEQEGMVGLGKKGFYIHGDADELALTFCPKVDLIFIDGHHDYDSVKANTLNWEPKMKEGSVMLFHDYDHPETKRWLDEHYGDKKEVLHDKIVRVRK